MTVYKRDSVDHDHQFDQAYESIASPQFDPEWHTIASLLRAGDVLELRWTVDNSSENTRKVDYVRDELDLVVYRQNNRIKRYSFHIAVRVGPDNSARMVRRGPMNVATATPAGVR